MDALRPQTPSHHSGDPSHSGVSGRTRCGWAFVVRPLLTVFWLHGCMAVGIEDMTLPPVEEAPVVEPAREPTVPDLSGKRAWPGEVNDEDGIWSYTDPGELPTIRDATGAALPLVHTAVEADLRGHIADVTVTQTFRNDAIDAIEVVYAFPLPENAAVGWMRIVVGDRIVESEIKERSKARSEYVEARKDGHTAALLEQERPNIFTQSLANLPPGEDIDIEIRYVQTLTYDAGEYEFVFPMVVGPRYLQGDEPNVARIQPPVVGKGTRRGDDFTIEVTATTGHAIERFVVPSHEVDAAVDDDTLHVELVEAETLPNRDFVLRYGAAGSTPRATMFLGDGGHYLLTIHPPDLDVDRLVGRREFIFVVDRSGSMSGVPLALAKEAVRGALGHLRPVDTFNVVGFAAGTQRLFERPRPANRTNVHNALQFLGGMAGGGGTRMGSAVEAALTDDVEKGRHRYVLFLTDGFIGAEDEIFAGATDLVNAIAKRGQIARVFAVGIGASPNTHLIAGLAKAGGGVPMTVSNRETTGEVVGKFIRYVDHPVIEDLLLEPGSLRLSGQHPQMLGDLYASHAEVVVGEYRGKPGTSPRLKGTVDGEEVELPVTVLRTPEGGDVLDALWARAAVADLEPDLWQGKVAAKRKITRLGLEHHIVTAFTSLVAVDRSRVVSDGTPRAVVEPTLIPEDVDEVSSGAIVIGHTSAETSYRVTGVSVNEPSLNRPSFAPVMEFVNGGKTQWPPRARLLMGNAKAPKGIKVRPFKQVIRSVRRGLKRCYEASPEFDLTTRYHLKLELLPGAVNLWAAKLDPEVHRCMDRLLQRRAWPAVRGRIVIPLWLSAA